MALETGNYINDLVVTNPLGTDPKSAGDDHIRLLKNALKNSFAGFAGIVLSTGVEAQGATVNDYTVTLSPAPAAYTTSMLVLFKATHANTGAATLQINGLGSKTLQTVDGQALVSGLIANGEACLAWYDGTNFLLISAGGMLYAPTPSVGDASTRIATTAFVAAQAFSAILPGQTGNAGKYLTTDGVNAFWAPLSIPVTQDEVYAMKANIAMNAFRTAALGSYSFLKMVDGVADDYIDQTGVNTAATYGYLYESATKSYACGPSYLASGGSGNRTASITVTTNLAITQGVLTELVNGDFTAGNRVYFTYDSDISNNYVQFDFGAGIAKSISEAKVYAYESTTRGYWKWQGSNNGSSWTDISSSVQILYGITTWTITDQTAYRYFRIQGVSGGIDAAGGQPDGWGEVEFKVGTAGSAALISNSVTALATPTTVQVIVWEEDISTPTLNTDLTAWVSRETGKTFTTNFAGSSTSISSTSHGFVNGDRVMLSSSSALPSGLSSAIAYFVVSSAANTFSVSLTSGGSAVTFSSDGSGTHTARKMAQVTLTEESVLTSGGRILSGAVDISGQANGTAMRYAIVAPTGTATRIHATSVQWK